jgi:NifU-like protein involved in Fe-S cluster formation/bacterioferritin-associated ferredoxin
MKMDAEMAEKTVNKKRIKEILHDYHGAVISARIWQNPSVSIYPDQVSKLSYPRETVGDIVKENAIGKSASFVCGSFVQFGLCVEQNSKCITNIRYATNGCGFAISAAETLAREFRDTALTDLHGTYQIEELIILGLGDFPQDRAHCTAIVVAALRAALADYRERVIGEFQGEKALICTCFGVAEETITNLIEEHRIADLLEFSRFSNAGSGCGSCQMLIQELIDAPKN